MSRYKELMDRISLKAISERIPVDAKIELTHRCNMNCIHCYVNQNESTCNDELTFDEWARILTDIKNAGGLHLLLTGGEVLVRKDFLDIYVFAKKLGFIVTVYTNATLLTQKHIEVLKKYPPYVVEISIYGHSKSVYESITRMEESYKKCIYGINMLVSNGVRIKLKTMILKENLTELNAMKKYADSLKVPFNFDGIIVPRIDGSLSPLEHRLSPEEIVAQDMLDINRKKELAGIYSDYSRRGCAAGLSSFLIEPNGNMSICVLCREPRISLRKNDFSSAWIKLGKYRNTALMYPEECANCENKSLCWCPGFVNESSKLRDSFMCKLAQERVRKIING